MTWLIIRLILLVALACGVTYWWGTGFANGSSELMLAAFALYVGQRFLRAANKQERAKTLGPDRDTEKLQLEQDARELIGLNAAQSPVLLYGAWFGGWLKVAAVAGALPIGPLLARWATGAA
jgi:hypothetical protein